MQRPVYYIFCNLIILAVLLIGPLAGAARAQESAGTAPRTSGTIKPDIEKQADAAPGQSAMPVAPGTPKKDRYQPTPDLTHVFASLPPDMQEELLAEMDNAHRICAGSVSYRIYHDCDCIAVKFLDRRLMKGPEFGFSNLMYEVSRECVNEVEIAGNEFQRCLMRMQQYGDKYKEKSLAMCECVGNEYAKAYAAVPVTSMRYQMNLAVNAQLKCGFGDILRERNLDADMKRMQRDNYLP